MNIIDAIFVVLKIFVVEYRFVIGYVLILPWCSIPTIIFSNVCYYIRFCTNIMSLPKSEQHRKQHILCKVLVRISFLILWSIMRVSMAMYVEKTEVLLSTKDGLALLDEAVQSGHLDVYNPVLKIHHNALEVEYYCTNTLF